MKTDYKVIHIPEIDSTNNYAQKLIDEQYDLCNSVIITDFQTLGKGSYNNHWESKRAENLTFSVILCPALEVSNQFYLSKIASLSLISYLESLSITAKIKWPNDILVENKKITGILIENSIIGSKISNSIIGIGLNINQKEFSLNPKATSLSILSGFEYNLKKELDTFLLHFKKFENNLNKKEFDFINKNYFLHLLGVNSYLRYKNKEKTFEAVIENIEENGKLVLKSKSGEIMKFGFKEVELIY